MTDIARAIRILRQAIDRDAARVAIVSDHGRSDESSLMATRDGYLNLAIQLLEFVDEVDERRAEQADGVPWSNRVADSVYGVPVLSECTLVGAYLYPSHEALLGAMHEFLESVLPANYRLDADPDFSEPPDSRLPPP